MTQPKPQPGSGKRARADWEAIGRDYRAGQVSVREISRQHGVSEAAIRQHARKYGWSRDLSARIRQGVRSKVAQHEAVYSEHATEETVSEAVEKGVEIVHGHQAQLRRLKARLERVGAKLDEWLDPVERDGDEAVMRIFASKGDGVASLLQALTASTERVIRLERQAYALDADREDDKDYERELEEARARVANAGSGV